LEVAIADFETFYASEHARVFRAVHAFCGERQLAEDCTQEAFARALARWRRLKQEQWVGAWVTTVAINASKKALKSPATDPVTDEHSPVSEPLEERHAMLQALRQLPRRQREAVVLHYLSDCPVITVAELMNISEGSVKTHLARARSALRELLEEIDV
jgi:RNA polymerase sigma-70 factor, ECF subfamily